MFKDDKSLALIKIILDSFYREKKVAVGLVDSNGSSIWAPDKSKNFSPLCRFLFSMKTTRDSCERDHLSRASSAKNDREVNICHAGLMNIAIPITIGDKKVGTVLCGQKLIDDDGFRKSCEAENSEFISKLPFKESTKNKITSAFQRVETISMRELVDLSNNLKNATDLIYSVAHERTELSNARNQLEMNLNNAAHEIQIYNQGAVATAARLHSKLEHREEGEMCKKILGQLSHMGTTVENMLWEQDGLKKFDDLPVNLIPIIETCIDHYQLWASERYVKIVLIKNSINNIRVNGSKILLNNLFNNLIHNAVKYSYKGTMERVKEVIVEIGNIGNLVIINIKNFGIGIMAEEIGKIWQSGVRGELVRDEQRTGTGMGLKIVKEIVDHHRGQINVKSLKQEGSAFLNVFTVGLVINI